MRALTSVLLWSLILAGSSLASGAGAVERSELRLALLAVAVAGACTAGRLLPGPLAAPYGFVVAAAVAASLVLVPDGLSGGALAGPLGYGNANGALCAQGAVAALVPVVACRSWPLRAAALALAVALVALAAQTGSRAGTAVAAGSIVLVVAALLAPAHRARFHVLAAALASAAALTLTVALGAAYEPGAARSGTVDRLVDRSLSERRVVLWSDSLDLLREHARTGVGVGEFDEASPTARGDADARWAHSAFLQHGAESGLPGLVAMLGVCVAGYRALWRAAAASRLAVVGACAATASLMQASVDYTFHFPVLPLLTALTVGVCAAQRPSTPRAGAAPATRWRQVAGRVPAAAGGHLPDRR